MNIPIVHFDDVTDGEPPAAIGVSEQIDPMRLSAMRAAQQQWAAAPIKNRLRVIRRLRHGLADGSADLVRALGPQTEAEAAEILAAQIIPLADACKFLEREAASILQARKLARRSAPLWLRDSSVTTHREPLGIVLVIAPSNYPLFLPGVVVVQALAAGNAVLIKPAPGCAAVANALLESLRQSGLPENLCAVLSENNASVHKAIVSGANKVVFTGSVESGRAVLRACADELVPATMELSGSDAMFVRADADVTLAARALFFGLRWNRGATCIAPRRVFVHHTRKTEFENECVRLASEEEHWKLLPEDAPVTRRSLSAMEVAGERSLIPEVRDKRTRHLAQLLVEAAAGGAHVIVGEVDHCGCVTAPVCVTDANPSMRLMIEDHFGPVAAVVCVQNDEEALAANELCPYALGASIFSRDASAARAFAARINAGNIVINDVIVPTADPRVPFGGRKQSGFGVTRGAEGLIELTHTKVVITRRGKWRPHFSPTRDADAEFFTQFLRFTHASKWQARLKAFWSLISAARTRKTK